MLPFRAEEIANHDFEWSCTLNLNVPVSFFGMQDNHSNEDILTALQAMEHPWTNGILNGQIVNGHLPRPSEDRFIMAETVTFDKVFRTNQGAVATVKIETPRMPFFRLARELEGLWQRTYLPKSSSYQYCIRSDLAGAVALSRNLESSFTVHHPELRLFGLPHKAIGLDLLWAYFAGDRNNKFVSERCLFTFSMDYLFLGSQKPNPKDVTKALERNIPTEEFSSLIGSYDSLTFARTSNTQLFDLLNPIRNVENEPSLGYLLFEVEKLIPLLTPGCPSAERGRLEAVERWLDKDGRVEIEETSLGCTVLYGKHAIAKWQRDNSRLRFAPEEAKNDFILYSPPISQDDVLAVLPSMVLDAIWTRKLAGKHSRYSKWLGPMDESFFEAFGGTNRLGFEIDETTAA